MSVLSRRSTQAACEVDLLKAATSKAKRTQGQQALHFLYAYIYIILMYWKWFSSYEWCLKQIWKNDLYQVGCQGQWEAAHRDSRRIAEAQERRGRDEIVEVNGLHGK